MISSLHSAPRSWLRGRGTSSLLPDPGERDGNPSRGAGEDSIAFVQVPAPRKGERGQSGERGLKRPRGEVAMGHCGVGDGLATGPHAADPTGPRQHPRLCGVSWASGSLCPQPAQWQEGSLSRPLRRSPACKSGDLLFTHG